MFTITLSGIASLLKYGFLMFGYIQGNQVFPEPLTPEDEKIFLDKLNSRK